MADVDKNHKPTRGSPYVQQNPALNIMRWSPTRQLFTWAVVKNTVARSAPLFKFKPNYSESTVKKTPRSYISPHLVAALGLSAFNGDIINSFDDFFPKRTRGCCSKHKDTIYGRKIIRPNITSAQLSAHLANMISHEQKHPLQTFFAILATRINLINEIAEIVPPLKRRLPNLAIENGDKCPLRILPSDLYNYGCIDPEESDYEESRFEDVCELTFDVNGSDYLDRNTHPLLERHSMLFDTENFKARPQPILPIDLLDGSNKPKRVRDDTCIPLNKFNVSGIVDDFYLNLLDWGLYNIVAIGIGNCVYLIDVFTSKRNLLVNYEKSETVTSVKFSPDCRHVSVGLRSGYIDLWDISQSCSISRYKNHSQRVSVIDWKENIITSGSRDRFIVLRDIREPQDPYAILERHKQEVCGLKWNHNGSRLASGGNDNKLFIWKEGYTSPEAVFHDHIAAIKGISWKPNSLDILATGGGTADRSIKLWDTRKLELINSLDTGSQVCNITWNHDGDKMISTHGYSLNQISIWNCKNNQIAKNASFYGHSYRVLFLASSPDRNKIATAAGDELMKIWGIGQQKIRPTSFYEATRLR